MNYLKIKQIIDRIKVRKAIFNCDTSGLCSIRAGGRAAALVTVDTAEELISLITALEKEDTGYLMLGGGTNMVFAGGSLDRVLIRLGRSLGKIIFSGEDQIEAGAAASTAVLVSKAAAAGLDLTFLSGIPGTVGGAVSGNSGSAERWICDSIIRLKYVHRSKTGPELTECTGDDIVSGYRFFKMPGLIAIVSTTLKLNREDPAVLASNIKRNMAWRKSSQPVGARTSGCFFKNPDNTEKSAGALIEKCGLKGFLYGGARISPVHANFIENFKSASPHDIMVLSKIVKDKVREKYGISLEYEVELIG